MSLTPAQVTLLTNWVQAGGDLVAMAPDAQLASLLGITPASGTVDQGYLAVDTSTAPGNGITAETMQFHGSANRYTLSGATAVATLFTDADHLHVEPGRDAGGRSARTAVTPAPSPSTWPGRSCRPARATRPGPARSATASSGLRSSDLFYGQAADDPQPDWVNLDKVAIPQADEQQRLLANVLTTMAQDQLPLPRLWYLPARAEGCGRA